MKAQLLILDYGSQYTQLIARAVRELGVYCEIVPGNCSVDRVQGNNVKAIILSGGPASVRTEGSPRVAREILGLGLPIFGICYGMQLLAQDLGGEVSGWGRDALSGDNGEGTGDGMREFGPARVRITNSVGPFKAFRAGEELAVWMSHGDKVTGCPAGFTGVASSDGSPIAAFANEAERIFGVQFHPEVHHTPRGKEILQSFLEAAR